MLDEITKPATVNLGICSLPGTMHIVLTIGFFMNLLLKVSFKAKIYLMSKK